ncbi:MAG: peptidoglycan-binding domain-containing protein [Lysobacterales bacterium]|jgi:hypothetical protein
MRSDIINPRAATARCAAFVIRALGHRAAVAAAVGICCLSGVTFTGEARADIPAVWVVGQQWNEEQPSERWSNFVSHREEVCRAVSTAKVQYEGAARAEIGGAVAEAGLPSHVVDDAMNKLDRGVNELCSPEPGQPPAIWSTFLVIYMSCMMRMSQDDMSMAILLPPGTSDAYMEVVRKAEREGMRVDMKRDLNKVTTNVGKGTSTTLVDMEPIPGTEQIQGYMTQKYKFSYSISMGDQMFGDQAAQAQAAFGNLAEMTRVTSSGTIWAAQDAPGDDIVKAFYDNFSTLIVSGQGVGSAYGGMMKNLAGLVRHGMPMKTDTTVHSAMGGTAHSKSEIKLISVGALPESMCGGSIIPPDYKITDVSQMTADSTSSGSARPGTGAGNSADMSAAMSQMNEAMKSLTPEQREMMEKMGMGGLIQGSAAAAPASAGAGAGGASSSSASMTTDNLVQTVQNYLQALGYDPGPADGKAGTQTMIAISQFQAEKGMKVTGEVTPQLAGILAAEVDARR